MSIGASPTHASELANAKHTLPTRWAAANGEMSPGRFRLYVSYACPWSHRVLIARALNGLSDAVEVVNAEPEMDDIGWRLERCYLADRYLASAPAYIGKATVPLMIDAATGQVVSNESADLMRMLGTVIPGSGHRLFPAAHAVASDAWNADLQVNVNARVYQYGIAAKDEDKAIKTLALMEAFDRLNRHLADHPYLVTDDTPLEPDWRLWATLARYDLAYRPFMLGPEASPLASFAQLDRFFARLLAVPGISTTYRPEEITRHYAARLEQLTHQLSPNAPKGDRS